MAKASGSDIRTRKGSSKVIERSKEWLRERASSLQETGLSYAEIGRRLGVSRQRVFAVLHRQPDSAFQAEHPPVRLKVMLTTREVANLFGIHENTVRRWSDTGKLKAYRIGQRRDRRFVRTYLEKILRRA